MSLMNIVVLTRLVPDLVEELTIADSGVAIDTAWLRQIINELDNHALEQAILLKESSGGQVTVIAPEAEGVDEMLYAALAKGADRLIKLGGDFQAANNHDLATAAADAVRDLAPDLVLTGVQAHNDLDGAVGPLLAEYAGLPYVGYIADVAVEGTSATVRKEYPGGLAAELTVTLPAVLGIQVAPKPPRYVAVSKIRQAMSTGSIEDRAAPALPGQGGAAVGRMFAPEPAERATMLRGADAQVAAQLVDIFRDLGVL
jgi:electron transfer flavoprotein beta subunit